MRSFDLCVIGSGPAGQRAAIQAAKLGKSVCVIEARNSVGGNAVHTGTIPSKALREAILSVSACPMPAMPTSADFILAAKSATIASLWTSANRVIRAETEIVQNQFASNSITLIVGHGSFVSADTVRVKGPNGELLIKAGKILIAVGTEPAMPPGIAFDGTDIINSDHILTLTRLPKSMIVVGGGVIGTEYASMMAALGVKVTLIEGRTRLLDFVDSEITEALQYHLRQAGVTLRMGEKVVTIKRVEAPGQASSENKMLAEAMLESGKLLRADCLLYCIGRQGCVNALNLEAAGLHADNRGRITVDRNYQTSVPSIYAAGDVIGFPALASTSMEQGRLAACHMFGNRFQAMEELLPYGIYSIPEISMVGWTEERLTQEGIPFESGIAHYRETARGQLIGDDIGMLKLLVHQESHAILGVHAIGTGATELIHIGQCAIAFKATVEYFINTVFNYPTLAECYKVAALNAVNKLHHT